MKAGEAIRSYFTSERDLWGARVNQVLDARMTRVNGPVPVSYTHLDVYKRQAPFSGIERRP